MLHVGMGLGQNFAAQAILGQAQPKSIGRWAGPDSNSFLRDEFGPVTITWNTEQIVESLEVTIISSDGQMGSNNMAWA